MAQDLSTRSGSRGWALAVLCAMQLMVILDGTIVTVTLPTIQRDLGFDQAGLAWVMNSYLIAFAVLLLSGRLRGHPRHDRRLFPEQGAQAKAIGVYSSVSASGAAIGLICGGVIAQTLGWHWAFLVNDAFGGPHEFLGCFLGGDLDQCRRVGGAE